MSVSCPTVAARNAQGCAIALTNLSATDFDIAFGGFSVTVTAGIRVLRAGDIQERVGSSYTTQNTDTEWIEAACEASDVGDDYEVRVEQTSKIGDGTFVGTLNTWQTINTTRDWYLTHTDNGFASGTWQGTIRIRKIGDAGSEVSASIFLSISIEL